MKKTEMLAFKEKLHIHSRRLRGDVTAMAEVALRKSGIEGSDSNAMPIHMAELGSDNFEQEFTLGLMEADEDTLDLSMPPWNASKTAATGSACSAKARSPRPG